MKRGGSQAVAWIVIAVCLAAAMGDVPFAIAGGDEVRGSSVAYVYDWDIASRDAYWSLMNSQGHSVTTVGLSDVPTFSFDLFDVIVIGSDTGYSAPWGPTGATANVSGAGLPIIGLGAGGLTFFEDVGGYIGTHGFGSASVAIDVTDPGHVVWNTPDPITIPPDRRLELYTLIGSVDLVYMDDSPPPTVTCMGYSPEWPAHCALTFEEWSGRLTVQWSFRRSPAHMTAEAEGLFSNLLHYLSASSEIFAEGFESGDTSAWSATVP